MLAACRDDGRTPVLVYSPHGRDQLALLERVFEQERPDVDVRWLDMGSQEIVDRLRFERVNPQADVWFGGPATLFARGVTDSLIVPTTRRTSSFAISGCASSPGTPASSASRNVSRIGR